MRVELTEAEVRIIRWLAAQRSAMNRRTGTPDMKFGGDDSLQIDIDGLTGEFGLAKLFNLWPDMDVGNRPVDDLQTPLGGVDVKTTRRANGRLIGSQKKTVAPSDWYALMWLEDERTVHFMGAARKDDLFDQKNLRDLGRGLAYVMDQEDLVQPHQFQGLLNGKGSSTGSQDF